MQSFKELNLPETLISALEKEQITVPTKIQLASIPLLLEKKDLVMEAITGSGKTLAYLLPLFMQLNDSKELQAIILAPTHELVIQISNVFKAVNSNGNLPFSCITILGNVNIKRQIESLKTKPQMVIGTPGRVLELIQLKKIKSHQVQTIVIDEADKLLSDNYRQDVSAIIKTTLRDRQLVACSASIESSTLSHLKNIMKEPEFILLKEEKSNQDISHYYFTCESRDKVKLLRSAIHAMKPEKSIVFLNKNELIQDVTATLLFHKIKAGSIFGNATKQERKKALDDFRSGKINVLVASDLAARGLDLKDVSHVFSLDLPADLKEYVHRAGRTGRAGKQGISVLFLTPKEIPVMEKYSQKLEISFSSKRLHSGKVYDENRR